MKTLSFQKSFLAAAIGLALSAMTVAAQTPPDNTAPPLSYGVPQILQLSQAGVGNDIITAYIHNSGNSYGLDANQIIYLKQQGISDNVLTAMLNQPKASPAPTQPAMQPGYSYATQAPVAYASPAAYDQTAQPSTVYVVPNNQSYYTTYYSQPYFYPTFLIPFQTFHGCCFARPCSFVSAGHFNNVGFHGAVAFHGNGSSFHGVVAFHGGGGGGMMMMHR